MWERLESREIRRRRASSARIAARRGITVTPPGDRPRPDRPEGDDLLPQIRHIVILMMENHSYDNYLGVLADRGEGLPLGPDGTPDVVNYTPDGRAYRAHHLSSTTQVKNDPSQNWHASHIQYADGRATTTTCRRRRRCHRTTCPRTTTSSTCPAGCAGCSTRCSAAASPA